MSRHTRRSLSLPARMAAAGVDRVFVAEATTLALGYGSQRLTNSRLWSDNMALRTRAEKAEAERARLRAALNEIATAASGIAHDIQIGPDDEGRDIYDMVQALQSDASQALKGVSHA